MANGEPTTADPPVSRDKLVWFEGLMVVQRRQEGVALVQPAAGQLSCAGRLAAGLQDEAAVAQITAAERVLPASRVASFNSVEA
ncbi:hypothetical protein [Agrobacterium sp. MS2]|jgi:hypothetical protein|uniref:hypothetical protein n=1 Tax=Agrobacterium sp. MS2 TaxID=1345498 RepID=UPI00256F4FF5|nr:hypothetical protein [Agrobacterium sp. MS2]